MAKSPAKPNSLLTRSAGLLSGVLAASFMILAISTLVLIATRPEPSKLLTAAELTETTCERDQEGPWAWWISRNYLMDNPDTSIALMGSSQVTAPIFSAESHFRNEPMDCVTDQQCKNLTSMLKERMGVEPKVNVFALGAAMASDQYLLSSALFNDNHKPRLIVIGVHPRDFIDSWVSAASASDHFRFLAPYVDLSDMLDYSFRNPLEKLDYLAGKPFVRIGMIIKSTGTAVAGAVGKLVASATSGSEKPGDATLTPEIAEAEPLKTFRGNIKPGMWKQSPTPTNWFDNNMEEYQDRLGDPAPPGYEAQKRFFRAFLREAREKRIGVLAIGMPSLKPNRQLLPEQFWKEFRGSISTICEQEGAEWLDLSDNKRFSPRDYVDTVHMNERGGAKLTTIIADQIASRKRLASCLSSPTRIAETDENKRWE